MSETDRISVRKGWSLAHDGRQAVRELYEQVHQPDAKILIVFCSSRYDLDQLGAELAARFNCPIAACTTAGEITSEGGYLEGGLVGVTLASDELTVHVRVIQPLSAFGWPAAERFAKGLREEIRPGVSTGASAFGLLLIDGLSMLEEQVTAALYNQFGNIPIVGGSAGDDLRFKKTGVYSGGRFHSDAAVFVLFETTLPFKSFRVQHFVPTETRLVITESDNTTRTVLEINGEPAAEAYAKAIGCRVKDLVPEVFAAHPMILRIGGEYFVRAIQRANADGSLTFYCAIDTGLVLTLARGTALVEDLRRSLEALRGELSDIRLVLGCDCILRRLEMQQKGLIAQAGETLRGAHFIGFSTYGEQFNGIHVNQTLTGIAIGGASSGRD